MVKILLDNLKGLSVNGDFSFKKRLFSTVDFSTPQADFDRKPSPMENLNLLVAVYTQFRGVTDERFAHKSLLKSTHFCLFEKPQIYHEGWTSFKHSGNHSIGRLIRFLWLIIVSSFFIWLRSYKGFFSGTSDFPEYSSWQL